MTPLYDRDGWVWQDGEWLPWREATTHLLTHTLHYHSARKASPSPRAVI
ncbi:hypothetical protein VRRI112168_18505 [Vreelandella rituensis]